MAKRKKLIPKHKPIDPVRAALEVVEAAIGVTCPQFLDSFWL